MIALSEERVLYEDENIYVFFRRLGNVLAISFNEMGYSSSVAGWGSKVFLELNYSSIGFVSKRPNWFPVTSMESAINSISSLLKDFTAIVAYGHSQGGYAAIKYSRHLGVKAVLSFCPQFSINPEVLSYNDKRFIEYFVEEKENPRIVSGDIANDVHAYMFYDPSHPQDKFNAERILQVVPTLSAVKVFGTGHSSVRPFASGKIIGELFRLALAGDALGVRRLSYNCKKNWRQRRTYLARSLVRSKQSLAIAVLEGYHHLLNKESAPEIIGFLSGYAKYIYLSENGLKFYKAVTDREVSQIFTAMLAADNVRDAIRLNAIHSLRSIDTPLLTDQFVPKTFFEGYEWVTFCEGWSRPESWGVWGTSRRSKLIIDWDKCPSGTSSAKIKIGQVLPGRLDISVVTSTEFQVGQQLNQIDDHIEVPRSGRITEVEFYCSDLTSPLAEGVNKDLRYLGVKLFHPKTWL